MEWIEVSAKTVAEAKELALDRLGVIEDELEVEVVDEPRSGLFGIGRVDARIRARVLPISREKPADRRRRSNTRGGAKQGSGGRGRGESRSAGSRSSGGRGSGGTRTAESRGPRTEGAPTETSDARPAREGSGAARPEGQGEGSGNRRRRRGGRGRSGGAGSGVTAAAGNGAGSDVERAARPAPRGGAGNGERVEADVDTEAISVEAQAEHAAKFAAGLVRAMGFDAEIETDIDEDEVLVRIEGDDLGVLVGPKGATLHALEEIVRAVVQHSSSGHSARVHVDVSGYRERRRAALAEFAVKIANEVRDTGSERSLEPMSPPDRKVVHDAVADVEGVATGSEGEEPSRRVVIRPA